MQATQNSTSVEVQNLENEKQIHTYLAYKGVLSGRTVEVVTCDYGTGHKVTASAVVQCIEKAGGSVYQYNLTQDDEALIEVDPLFCCGRVFHIDIKSADFFNMVLAHQLTWLFNLIEKIERALASLLGMKTRLTITPEHPDEDTSLKRLIRSRWNEKKPNLVVTTYHMNLNPFREVCRELSIPLLHIPTDFDVKARDIFVSVPNEPRFKSLLPHDNAKTLDSAYPIPKEKLINWGIPLREPLYKTYPPRELQEIRQEMGIDPKAKVILVMSGGGGQDVPFPDLLLQTADNGQKYHMIVIAGANNAAGDRIAGLKAVAKGNPNVTVHVAIDPTQATATKKYYIGAELLSRLYAVADCGFFKPGGISMYECFHVGLPVLIDARQEPLSWEQFNMDVMLSLKRGRIYRGPVNFLEQINEACALGKEPRNASLEDFVEILHKMMVQVDPLHKPIENNTK